jgi:hypothetical protein
MHAFSAVTRIDIWLAVVITLIVLLIWKTGLRFSVAGVQELVTVLNTKGGIIMVLGSLSLFFFIATIWVFYTILQDIKAGALREDNAVALLALQFCMNSAFSLCLGAMLKTMTGEAPTNTSITSSVSSSTTPHATVPLLETIEQPKTTVVTDAVKTVEAANKTVSDVAGEAK